MNPVVHEAEPLAIRRILAEHLESVIAELSTLLVEAVDGGASLGFLAPLSYDDARTYWTSLENELATGTQILLVVYSGERVVGSGQLTLAHWPNAKHRAEIHKLFVAGDARGLGIGKRLMEALHETAREHGRGLIMLNTRSGEAPETFYRRLGYKEVGVTPRYSLGADGRYYDDARLYIELGSPDITRS